MEKACVVLTTLDDADRSRALAREIIGMRLAACVQLVERTESFYCWEGATESAHETAMWIKTTEGRVNELREWLLAHHPYRVPEFLVLPVLGGSVDYLNWITQSTTPPPD